VPKRFLNSIKSKGSPKIMNILFRKHDLHRVPKRRHVEPGLLSPVVAALGARPPSSGGGGGTRRTELLSLPSLRWSGSARSSCAAATARGHNRRCRGRAAGLHSSRGDKCGGGGQGKGLAAAVAWWWRQRR